MQLSRSPGILVKNLCFCQSYKSKSAILSCYAKAGYHKSLSTNSEFSNYQSNQTPRNYIAIFIKGVLFSVGCGFLLSQNDFRIKTVQCKTQNKQNDKKAPTPSFTIEEVSQHTTPETGIWVSYNGSVYDITDFVNKHPGGKIIYRAAGGGLEPFYEQFPVHKQAGMLRLLEKFKIGQLQETTSSRTDKTVSNSKIFTEEEVAQHTTASTGIWVTYEGHVYDITDFVSKHPGGNKILLAAGGALEPFWALYAVHKSKEVLEILAEYRIGKLKDSGKPQVKANDPFSTDPKRHPALKLVSQKPFNAESPPELMMDNLVTPNELFFVRNHLPVPQVDINSFSLNLSGLGVRGEKSLTVSALKSKFPKRTVRSSVMCAGNRRNDMSTYKAVKGLSWKGTAISTADWSGVSLRDLLNWAGVDVSNLTKHKVKHIQFEGLDKDPEGMHYGASVPIEIASGMLDDIIIAYEMNGKELPADHGYPLRVIIPGIVGARQVKWLHKIVLSTEESPSFWQQRDYKTFSPSTDWSTLDYTKSPAIMEPPVISAICMPQSGEKLDNEGSLTVKGYAWSGGGRGILRVEISIDGGETWHLAELHPANENSYFRKRWAWTLWEAEVPLKDDFKGKVEIVCKAVDTSQNTQPETFKGIWNVRGLLANAWHRVNVDVVSSDEN